MSMISEITAAGTAECLEKILYEAMTSGNETIKVFAKKHIYQWYLDECAESWGVHKVNPEIKEEFEKK